MLTAGAGRTIPPTPWQPVLDSSNDTLTLVCVGRNVDAEDVHSNWRAFALECHAFAVECNFVLFGVWTPSSEAPQSDGFHAEERIQAAAS